MMTLIPFAIVSRILCPHRLLIRTKLQCELGKPQLFPKSEKDKISKLPPPHADLLKRALFTPLKMCPGPVFDDEAETHLDSPMNNYVHSVPPPKNMKPRKHPLYLTGKPAIGLFRGVFVFTSSTSILTPRIIIQTQKQSLMKS